MAEETLERAQKVYETLCQYLDNNEWHYEKNDEVLCITCGAQGDDLPMELMIRVDAKRQLIVLLSRLPFIVPEDKRLDFAIATSVVNYDIVDGSFDFDITDGTMFFRMTNSFIESDISASLLSYFIIFSCHTIDEYNDKFFLLAKGLISLEDFMKNQ